MKHSIFILYTGNGEDPELPNWSESQNYAYHSWGRIAEEQGITLMRGDIFWYSVEKRSFSRYWRYEKGQWIKVLEPILPAVVYDKSRNYSKSNGKLLPEVISLKQEIEKVVPIINDPDFSILFDNKLHQAVIFKDYLPKSNIVRPGEILMRKDNDPIVVKAFHGSGGKQVIISDADNLPISEKSLQQEFIPATKNGELKDIRVVFLGEEPQYALSRKASKGSYHTNFHQGATIDFVNLSELNDLLELCKEILPTISIFKKKIFSLDFLQDAMSGKYYLVEINTMPGLDVFDSNHKLLEDYLSSLTKYLIKE